MEMVLPKRNQLTTSILMEFTPNPNKKDQRERRIVMDGTASLMIQTKLTGARATKTSNTRLTLKHLRLSLVTANHPRVPTPLRWVDTSLSERKDKETLLLVLKILTTRPAEIEFFF